MSGKVWVTINLANVGCLVEEEAEPPKPIKELGFAYSANLGWKTHDGTIGLPEEGYEARVFLCRRTFKAWIPFFDVHG